MGESKSVRDGKKKGNEKFYIIGARVRPGIPFPEKENGLTTKNHV